MLHRGGQAGYHGGFISHYLIQVIYPPGLTRGIQIRLGLFVVLIAVAGYTGYLRRHWPVQAGARVTDQQPCATLASAGNCADNPYLRVVRSAPRRRAAMNYNPRIRALKAWLCNAGRNRRSKPWGLMMLVSSTVR